MMVILSDVPSLSAMRVNLWLASYKCIKLLHPVSRKSMGWTCGLIDGWCIGWNVDYARLKDLGHFEGVGRGTGQRGEERGREGGRERDQ